MISVCMATYNGEKYLHQQVESILSQLSEEDEIIVSDDESSDSTLVVLQAFNDKRIKVFTHKRKTENVYWDYTTRNFENALMHANGDYIFLSDQDDVFLPDKIRKMKSLLCNAYDLVICDCKLCDGELKELGKTQFETDITKSYFDVFTRFRMLGCCMAFRKELLDKALPFPKTKAGHDLWLFLMAKYYGSIIYLHEPLHLFRRHENTVTTAGGKSHNSFLFRVSYRMIILQSFLLRIIFGK
ncbi:MAG: glycosyltransferase [Bacteroidales bacterium]|nr:glycosyltransferase [Bacteroidales bacterium]